MNGKQSKSSHETKRLMPLFCWNKKAVAAAAGCFKVKAPAGGFDLQKKLIRLPRNSLIIYSSSWGNQINFFRCCFTLSSFKE